VTGGASEFESDTAVWPGEGGYRGDIHPRWNIGENPNGGYLVAVAVRAMQAEARRPDPISVTAHFLSPPAVGPVTVRTRTVKAGRSFVTVTGEMTQAGKERVRLVGAFGDLATQSGPTRVSAQPPALPPPEDCVRLDVLTRRAGRPFPEAMARYDIRLAPDSPFGQRSDSGPFEITGWIRFSDQSAPTTLSLLTFSDAFPPTLLGSVEARWLPTVELTVHVRGTPAPGWMRGVFRTRFLVDGLLEEDGELWDSADRPVALSRQLALVLNPS
jgi:hypothetical protein